MGGGAMVGGLSGVRSDIWSLGTVAFECLTGKRPFEGETLGAFALAIHTLSLPKLTKIKPELPPQIDRWFERACARSRDARFVSAIEAAEALAYALGTHVPAIRKTPPLPTRAQKTGPIPDDLAC